MNTLHRKLYHSIIQQTDNKYTIIITGPRQTGKTTLLFQIKDELKTKGFKPVFLTLEDPAILSRLNQHPENIFEFVLLKPEQHTIILIDEIQYLDNPSNFLKLLYDKYAGQLKIIATGSSAFYIDEKFTDSLAGRKKLFELYTLDFDEFLLFRTNDNTLTGELNAIREHPGYRSARRNELEALFNEYLIWGGYPAVVLESDTGNKTAMLKEITGSYLKRDILESNIRDQDKFHGLLMILARQTGSLVNINELSRVLNLSVTAIENYIYILQKCFHIAMVKPFAGNIRKELTRMPKVYFHDIGFRNVLLSNLLPLSAITDQGVVAENYAFIRLRAMYGTDRIRYWRTADGHEIDFVVTMTPDTGMAIEIKTDSKRFQPSKYSKFTGSYPGYPLHCRALTASGNADALMAL